MGGMIGKMGGADQGGDSSDSESAPMWAKALKGGLGGASKSLLGQQQMQQGGGGFSPAPISAPTLPGDFYQTPDYLKNATQPNNFQPDVSPEAQRARMMAFYGGR